MVRGRMQVLGLVLVLGLTTYAAIGLRPDRKDGMYRSAGETERYVDDKAVDPNQRMQNLIHGNFQSGPSPIEFEWERIWFSDEPSHLKPERGHGGVQ